MTQLRCPVNPSKLFAILRTDLNPPLYEVACQHCRQVRNRHALIPDITAVLHLYDVNGQCVQTEIIRSAVEVAS